MTAEPIKKTRSPLTLLLLAAVVVFYQVCLEQEPTTPPPDVTQVDRGLTYGGIPRDLGHACPEIQFLENTGFVVGYCNERKNPMWVAYKVFPRTSDEHFERPRRFSVDERTSARVSHNDYTNSGYDRGHMAPNHAIATLYGKEAQEQTFLMSNITPQAPKLNQQVWRLLEQEIANEYGEKLQEVWVFTGPVFDQDIQTLESGVEIPDAFYMILVDEQQGSVRTRGYLIPQEVQGDESAEDFLVSIDQIERATGLDFLWQLQDAQEEQVEVQKATGTW